MEYSGALTCSGINRVNQRRSIAIHLSLFIYFFFFFIFHSHTLHSELQHVLQGQYINKPTRICIHKGGGGVGHEHNNAMQTHT